MPASSVERCLTPSELVRMNEVQVDHIELAPVGNHLLDELAQGVQEHNGPERLGRGIGGLARFGNHHQHTVLKVPRPTTHLKAGICQRQKHIEAPGGSDNAFEVDPRDVVRTRR